MLPAASRLHAMRFVVALLILIPQIQALDWQPVLLAGPAGPYGVEAWKRDWPGCTFENGVSEGRVSLVPQEGGLALRVAYASGEIGPDRGGAGWRWKFSKQPKPKAELRYTVMFEEGFDFVKGGKLPGLCGGPKTITGGDKCTGFDGWSARLMWRSEGRGQAYVYHPNQPSKYGDEFDFPSDFRFPTGMPVKVHLSVVINSIGQRDGKLRIGITLPQQAERIMVEKLDMEWTKTADIGADSILFNTFHGGSDSTWAPSRPCAARFSEFSFLR